MEEIPDLNIFMMCSSLNKDALTHLPKGYYVRSMREDELDIWASMPFDDEATAKEYNSFMMEFFKTVYGGNEKLFFTNTLFICDEQDRPVATCLLWKAYNKFQTIHWFKVLKSHEGKGIGRALLSIIMKEVPNNEYPVYLHTQPGSYRAIKLYSDFGFHLLTDKTIGTRQNDLIECLPILEKWMPSADYNNLKTTEAPLNFKESLKSFTTLEF
ncbi:GNAT family N-acetyltransferase [Sutcliffiella horikoshii]|uniref:GNAT family N-acetyltransferase n=1 Tax=Sutcliffiella horikoshii TaxID=79883 RepID=UPI003CF3DC40